MFRGASSGGAPNACSALRRPHRAVGLLAVLDQRQQRAAGGEGGAVQRVHVPRPPDAGAVADVEPPRLEVGGVGAGRQLPVALLAGQPDLDVVLLGGGGAEVAHRDVLHLVVEPQLLGDLLLDREQLVVGLLRLVGQAEHEHLQLVELVDAEDAARVLAGGAGLAAEARGEADVAQRQLRLLQDRAGVQRCQRHLGRADQEQVVLLDGVGLLARLREHAGALHRRLAHQHRRHHGQEALARQLVHAPLHHRQLQPHQVAQQVVEAAARHLRGGLDVDQAQSVGAGQLEVILRLEPEVRLLAVGADGDRVILGHAVGGGRVGQVRHAQHQLADALGDLAQGALVGRLLGLQLGLAGDRDRGVLALLLGLGDGLGRGVVRRPCLLHGGLQSPALTVQLQECIDQLAGAAARQRFADAVRLRADQLRVDHDLADTNASRKRATPSCSGPGTVASASSSRI